MILSYDCGKDRLSLSTKKLESVPGEMLQNPTLVYNQVSYFFMRGLYLTQFL